jgi:hypothetical protein
VIYNQEKPGGLKPGGFYREVSFDRTYIYMKLFYQSGNTPYDKNIHKGSGVAPWEEAAGARVLLD